MKNKTAEEWHEVFLHCWIRYFGAPRIIVSDQEGADVSDLISTACEAYDIGRDLQGSEGHTRTGMVERRIGIVKLAALKLYAQVQKQGLRKTQDDCISEACLSSTSLLVYGSNTPNQALLGYEPRDVYTIDNNSVSSASESSFITSTRLNRINHSTTTTRKRSYHAGGHRASHRGGSQHKDSAELTITATEDASRRFSHRHLARA